MQQYISFCPIFIGLIWNNKRY